jgi:hypothetical protein
MVHVVFYNLIYSLYFIYKSGHAKQLTTGSSYSSYYGTRRCYFFLLKGLGHEIRIVLKWYDLIGLG